MKPWVWPSIPFKPRMGRQKTSRRKLLSPHPGLDSFCSFNPRLAPWATLCRRSATRRPRPVRPPQTAIGSLQTATMAHGHQLGLCRGARPSRLAVSGVAPLLPATPKMKGRRSSSSALPKPTGKAKTSSLYQMPDVAIED